jgi:hypothetical protein
LLGLIVGLAAALSYAWLVNPVVYLNAVPARLSERYQAEYILLVSQSFAVDGDWVKAQSRLAALDDPHLAETVMSQLEEYLRQGRPAIQVRDLAEVARRLGAEGPALAVFAPTQPATAGPTAPLTFGATPTPTLLPTPTRVATARPTATSSPSATPTEELSPTPPPIYRLLSQERICRPGAQVGRIEVVVLDALLEPLPGIEIVASWEGGTDSFFTGFQPEQGAGYADFVMSPDTSYALVLAEGSPVVSGLRADECSGQAGDQPGGWRLTFQSTVLPTATPEDEE